MDAHHLREAAAQAQDPFLLVAGLLLLGLVADVDGLFAAASRGLLRITTSPLRLLLVALGLVTIVTAVLNLDTSVVFLTPVLIGAARAARVDEEAFLYGSVLMANAASLLLAGANLTNLLVLAGDPVDGVTFVRRTLPVAVAAAAVTAAGLLALAAVRGRHRRPAAGPPPAAIGARRAHPFGLVACAAAAALVLALRHPAIPVLALGVVAAAVRVAGGRLTAARALAAVGPLALVGLFALSVALGTLARAWDGPSSLLHSAAPGPTTGLAALAAIACNNLPAAVLLSAQPPPHPTALLLGLNLGPNLAVTGSLSAFLWFRAARASGARPSLVRFSVLGVPLALAAMAAGVAVAAL